MMRLRFAALLGACAVLAGCNEKAAAPEPVRPVMSMVVKPVQSGNAVIVGTVQPQFKTDLGFRVLGRLIARPVNIGDTVEKGQVVAAIDPAALELAVRSATAEVSNSQAQLTNASGAEGRQRTSAGDRRHQPRHLRDCRAGPRRGASFGGARPGQSHQGARAARLCAGEGGFRRSRHRGRGRGWPGGLTGQSVVTVARPDIREAVIDVSDDIAAGLRIGMSFKVGLQLDPAISATGKVREIAPQADPVTRTRRVRITLDNPPDTFRLGTTVITALAGDHLAAVCGCRPPRCSTRTARRSSGWSIPQRTPWPCVKSRGQPG